MVAFPPSSSLWILFILCSFVSTKIFQNSLSDSEIDQLQIRKRLSHSPFSYEKYWRRAALLAMREPHEVSEYQPYNDCLRVYVYNMPKYIQGPVSFEEITSPTWLNENVFLKKKDMTEPYEFATPQWVENILFFYRLVVDEKRKKNCFLTKNSSQADLFLIPLFLNDGKWGIQECYHTNGSSALHRNFRTQILGYSKFLDYHNACSHIMMHSQGVNNARDCKAWFSSPSGVFQYVLRVGGSPIIQTKDSILPHNQYLSFETPFFERSSDEFPYLVSSIYPSNVHWSREFNHLRHPWSHLNNTSRPILMLFTTGRSIHGDVSLREKIIRDCESYNIQSVCTVDHEKKISLKKKALFCLEPMGDSPWRKSIVDDLTYGCIPVFFSRITDTMAPYQWQGWRNRTRVLINRYDYLSGRIDLKKLLKSIPPSFLRILQKSIAKIGKRFQTSLEYDPGDAQSYLLRGILEQKKRCQEKVSKSKYLRSVTLKKKKREGLSLKRTKQPRSQK